MFLVIPLVEFLHVLAVDINVHHENPATFLCHVSVSSVTRSRHRFASSRWHLVLTPGAQERHETPTGAPSLLTLKIASLANIPVGVAANTADIDRRGCRPANCRRVRVCRRTRRRHSARTGRPAALVHRVAGVGLIPGYPWHVPPAQMRQRAAATTSLLPDRSARHRRPDLAQG